ncbi:MAG: hypothetical protein ACNI28_01220 [Arcobacter sp.]|uniref:hypothetical protein n=1 Tax=Arcobacter sp. TaxID=1872629 RepID=UPI003AFF702F
MKSFFTYFVIFFVVFFIPLNADIQIDTSQIKNYIVKKEFYTQGKNRFMIFRSYTYKENSYFLLINLDSLKTSIISNTQKEKLKKSGKSILSNSNYSKLVAKVFKNSSILSNAGINKSLHKKKNEIYLTIDMCPSSKKGYEKELFEEYLKSTEINKKIPISIAITYRWVKDHKKEFFSLIHNENLDITWINHSKNHYYNPIEKLSKNFMLNSKTNLREEVIEVEKLLILNNLTPSILFRLPGLISNQKLINSLVYEFSLIPLGTNNWLVKSDKEVSNGDIILIHGNLNEKEGVEKLINNQPNINRFKSIYNSLLTDK